MITIHHTAKPVAAALKQSQGNVLTSFAAGSYSHSISAPSDSSSYTVLDRSVGWALDDYETNKADLESIAARWSRRPIGARRIWRQWATAQPALVGLDPLAVWDIVNEQKAFVGLAKLAATNSQAFTAFCHKSLKLWTRRNRQATVRASASAMYEYLQHADWDRLARHPEPFKAIANAAGQPRRVRNRPVSTQAQHVVKPQSYDPIAQTIAILDTDNRCRRINANWDEIVDYFVINPPTRGQRTVQENARHRRMRRQRLKVAAAITSYQVPWSA